MRMPDHLVVDLQPSFGNDMDTASVFLEDRGFLCFAFGLLGQWAVTWNGRVHLTKRAPFVVESTGVSPRREGIGPGEARGNALWLISHECLHVKQQRETGWGRFLISYGWEWLHHGGGSRNKFEGPAYTLGDQVFQAFMKGLQKAYCFKCRQSREIMDHRREILSNGRVAVAGACTTCGSKVSSIIG